MVEVRDAGGSHKVQLSARFQELIDMAAMRRGLAGTDQYLAGWRRERQRERAGEPLRVAEDLAAEIEARYPQIREGVLASLDRSRDE